MDFFGIIYDMKNGKKVPYSKTYFDTLFAAKLGGSDVKTLTGTLPLTFRTSETALRSWTIYGADIEHVETSSGKSITFYTDEDKLRDWTIYGNAGGVGERTKNLLEITATSTTINGVTFTVDKTAGTITADGTASGNVDLIFSHTDIVANSQYVMSGSIESSSSTADRIAAIYIDQYAGLGVDYGSGFEFSSTTEMPNAAIKIRIFSGKTVTNAVFKPMLRPADTTPEFIPYGYCVPITVSQTGQTDKKYEIFIGDSPLTEGETISKSSTGVDIATADGNNTITTSLSNQPDLSITYNEFTGVGILTANLFIIALKLQAGGQTLNVFNMTLNKPLRAGETLTSEQTGQTINTVAGVENKLSPSPKAAAYGGNFEMTIKYKE